MQTSTLAAGARLDKAYTWPLRGHDKISAPYGDHTGAHSAHSHQGIDIPAPAGTKVYAARDGTSHCSR
jgi:murein DD-endopeptidase MepM/ murein hydrolase activator NlpD